MKKLVIALSFLVLFIILVFGIKLGNSINSSDRNLDVVLDAMFTTSDKETLLLAENDIDQYISLISEKYADYFTSNGLERAIANRSLVYTDLVSKSLDIIVKPNKIIITDNTSGTANEYKFSVELSVQYPDKNDIKSANSSGIIRIDENTNLVEYVFIDNTLEKQLD